MHCCMEQAGLICNCQTFDNADLHPRLLLYSIQLPADYQAANMNSSDPHVCVSCTSYLTQQLRSFPQDLAWPCNALPASLFVDPSLMLTGFKSQNVCRLPRFYGEKMRRKLQAGAHCEDLRSRCLHFYDVAEALTFIVRQPALGHLAMMAFRGRYKV